MPKNKKTKTKTCVLISSIMAERWFAAANKFAQSLITRSEAIHQYNLLPVASKTEIIESLKECDTIREKMIPDDMSIEEKNYHYSISVMVDAHILATEHNVDPVVIRMCLNPPCKIGEKVVVK